MSGPRLVALLRGVNVGGARRLPMAELRAALEGEGFTDVATYLQSGNVVLTDPDGDDGEVARRVARVASEQVAVPVEVLVRTAGEIAAALERHPFPDPEAHPTHHHLMFLTDAVDPEAVRGDGAEDERFAAFPREVHLYLPGGSAARASRARSPSATARRSPCATGAR